MTGWNEEEEQFLTLNQLAERFPKLAERFLSGLEDTTLLTRAVELGLLALDSDGVRIPRPSLLRAGEALVAAGIPLSAVLEELEKTKAYLQEIADGAVGLFKRYVWQPFVDAGMPPERLPEVTEALERLRPIATSVGQALLSQALERAAADATAEQVELISQKTQDTSKKVS